MGLDKIYKRIVVNPFSGKSMTKQSTYKRILSNECFSYAFSYIIVDSDRSVATERVSFYVTFSYLCSVISYLCGSAVACGESCDIYSAVYHFLISRGGESQRELYSKV